jgi:calcineurin-like phosphoesterase family protein
MRVFVISDAWFNRLLPNDQDNSVVDKNNRIIDDWNSVVDTTDTVYVLGGFGISDLYNVIVRLNGTIRFLNNYFNYDERDFIKEMKSRIEKSGDMNFIRRIVFETDQIKVLESYDSILSYFPLSDWSGKETGTYLFHGLNTDIDIEDHNYTSVYSYWKKPIDIMDIQKKTEDFKKVN